MPEFNKIFGYRWWKRRLRITALNKKLKSEAVEMAEWIADNLAEELQGGAVSGVLKIIWEYLYGLKRDSN